LNEHEQQNHSSDEHLENESAHSSFEAAKRKRGRPPGSKTKRVDVVDVDQPKCRSCGKTDSEHISTIRTMEHSHEFENQTYSHIRFQRRRCRECKTVFIVKQHLDL
jgi:transposase